MKKIDTATEELACWINKATIIQSEYVILIDFFPATVVKRTRLHVTFIRALHVLVCFDSVVHCTVHYDQRFRKTLGMSKEAGERRLYWTQQLPSRRLESRRLTSADGNVPVVGGHMLCICIQGDIGVQRSNIIKLQL